MCEFLNTRGIKIPYNTISHTKHEIEDLILRARKIIETVDQNVYFSIKNKVWLELDHSMFINRCTLKLASLDSLLNNLLTSFDICEYLDICGAPGGFCEYIQSEYGFRAKGYTISLGDYNFHKSSIMPYLPVILRCVDNDITNKQTRNAIVDKIDKVNLAMADGATGSGDCDFNLFCSQVNLALRSLAQSGIFFIKVFEFWSPKMMLVLTYVYSFFEKMAIVKPSESNYYNGERYIVFVNFQKPFMSFVDFFNNDQWVDQDLINYIIKQKLYILQKQLNSLMLFLTCYQNKEYKIQSIYDRLKLINYKPKYKFSRLFPQQLQLPVQFEKNLFAFLLTPIGHMLYKFIDGEWQSQSVCFPLPINSVFELLDENDINNFCITKIYMLCEKQINNNNLNYAISILNFLNIKNTL